MTFKKATIEFNLLSKDVQSNVWQQLNAKESDENKTLLSALTLAHLSPARQYQSLSLDFCFKGDFFPETICPQECNNIKKTLETKSIYELFRWKAVIEQKCGNSDFLKITLFKEPVRRWDNSWDNNYSYIKISKPELFCLNINHIKAIRRKMGSISAKKELLLFNDLSKNLLEAHYRCSDLHDKVDYGDNRIRFFYRDTITFKLIAKSALIGVQDQLSIILTLVYAHYLLNPAWANFTKTQNPVLLELNAKKELTNRIIPDGKDFIKHIINPIPFETDWPGQSNFLKATPYIPYAHSLVWMDEKTQRDLAFARNNEGITYFIENFLFYSSLLVKTSLMGLAISPIAVYASKIVFSYGLPAGLMGMGLVASLIGIKKVFEKKLKIINFDKNESIKEWLDNPDIEICE